MSEGYELLAMAILHRAVEDYRLIRKQHKQTANETEKAIVAYHLIKLERFFLSEYGELLSDGHGQMIIDRLHDEE